ncbi:MAG: rhomboid family intramembrane serine protease [Acidimicrobiales bacterium]
MADEVVERPRAAGLVTPLLPLLVMVAVMWGEEIVDTVLDGRLDRFGIRPREVDGLDGIVLSPFLHGGFPHLVANTLPFLVLGGAICVGSTARFLRVTVIVGLVCGVGTWLTGPAHSLHIGASGLVFGYLTYLVSRGLFARKLTYILGGIITFMLYGGALWGLLPSPGVSWQGHLFGALGGVVAAWLIHRQQGDDDGL